MYRWALPTTYRKAFTLAFKSGLFKQRPPANICHSTDHPASCFEDFLEEIFIYMCLPNHTPTYLLNLVVDKVKDQRRIAVGRNRSAELKAELFIIALK